MAEVAGGAAPAAAAPAAPAAAAPAAAPASTPSAAPAGAAGAGSSSGTSGAAPPPAPAAVGAVPEAPSGVTAGGSTAESSFDWSSWDGSVDVLPPELQALHGPVAKRYAEINDALAAEWNDLLSNFDGSSEDNQKLVELRQKQADYEQKVAALTSERDSIKSERERLQADYDGMTKTLQQSVALDADRWAASNTELVNAMGSDPAVAEAALLLLGSKDSFGIIPSELSDLWAVSKASDVPLADIAAFLTESGALVEQGFDWPATLTAVKAKYPVKTLALPPPGDMIDFTPGTGAQAAAPPGQADRSGMSPRDRMKNIL